MISVIDLSFYAMMSIGSPENSKDACNGGAQTDLIVGTTAQPKLDVGFSAVVSAGSSSESIKAIINSAVKYFSTEQLMIGQDSHAILPTDTLAYGTKQSPNKQTVIRIANRENPRAKNSHGVFGLGDDGNNVLLHGRKKVAWSSNATIVKLVMNSTVAMLWKSCSQTW
ncbi:hypothetical protein ACSBR1_028151 [Camellia fascicularis]